jgi:hypothetical protein
MAGEGDTTTGATTTAKPLPELVPWRVVGWMFRDGECVAIERQADQAASRSEGDE